MLIYNITSKEQLLVYSLILLLSLFSGIYTKNTTTLKLWVQKVKDIVESTCPINMVSLSQDALACSSSIVQIVTEQSSSSIPNPGYRGSVKTLWKV